VLEVYKQHAQNVYKEVPSFNQRSGLIGRTVRPTNRVVESHTHEKQKKKDLREKTKTVVLKKAQVPKNGGAKIDTLL